ncbi:MAG: AIR synthase related protein [Candidatus Sifarchaeia archaeon]|jgi:selenophosphate synthetase-related protein
MDIDELAKSLRLNEGIIRKKPIQKITELLGSSLRNNYVLEAYGEDSAAINLHELGQNDVILFTNDAMRSQFVEKHPREAGYFCVVVNVKDIYAMGGKPLGFLSVISFNNEEILEEILYGLKKGADVFKCPPLGGHIIPDAPVAALDCSTIGAARKDEVLYSHGSRPGDTLIVAIDTDGKETPFTGFDNTSFKHPKLVRSNFETIRTIAHQKLATSCKDISMPGIIGTLAMMLEVAGTGSLVDITKIPKPTSFSLEEWLKVNPGFGYLITTHPNLAQETLTIFEKQNLAAAVVGEITKDKRVAITDGKKESTVFDFTRDSITGIKPWDRYPKNDK